MKTFEEFASEFSNLPRVKPKRFRQLPKPAPPFELIGELRAIIHRLTKVLNRISGT